MKLQKLSLIGYLTGCFIILLSSIRWFIKYNDPSQASLGIAIGIIVLGGSYIYQRLSELTKDIEELNRGLDAIRIWSVDKFEKMSKDEKK